MPVFNMFDLDFSNFSIFLYFLHILLIGDIVKVILLYKKYIFFICLLAFILLFIFLSFYFPFSFAVDFSSNSSLAVSLKDKMAHLTENDEKIAYLTFDDGPTLKATGKILDILKKEDVKATFFVIGKYVKNHPELVKRAYEEGHYIANHGYSHDNPKLYQSDESFISEVKNTDAEIGKAIGVDGYCSRIFRFPNGFMSPVYKSKKEEAAKLLSDMGYVYVDWNCLNKDSEQKYSSTQLLQNLKNSCKNKGTLIVLMHDSLDVSDSSAVLKDSISFLRSQGYVFQNFYDLL